MGSEKMEAPGSQTLPAIDLAQLSGVVRRSTGCETFQIQDWQIQQLGGGVGNPVSVGLYRLEGNGLALQPEGPADGRPSFSEGRPTHWSVILKIIQSPANLGYTGMGEGDDPTHWNYWKRELLVYQSGFLRSLPEGLIAPECYGVEERPGSVAWLWLQDVSDGLKPDWTVRRYARTARHLGRLNGRYAAGQPLPEYPWLSQYLLRQWVASMLPELRALDWDHPWVVAHYPQGQANPFRRMLGEVERFQAMLERIPKTICHGDTYPTNFAFRENGAGEGQTIARDWALMGVAPLGDDLGQLALGAWTSLKEPSPAEMINELFESYLTGLRDSGCQADPRWVRLGFTASAALRIGIFQLILISSELAEANSQAGEKRVEPSRSRLFDVAMAQEAYGLLEELE